MNKTYTGIGSRATPKHILNQMTAISFRLSNEGYTLRSGKAVGADMAFQLGVQESFLLSKTTKPSYEAEIYIPWKGFKGGDGLWDCWDIHDWSDKCYDVAGSIHPAWKRCSQGAKRLHARNVCQVLGKNLDNPSSFVIFYAEEVGGKIKGGTATAVNLAKDNGVPTINMFLPDWEEKLARLV